MEGLQAIPVLLPQDNTKPLGSDTMPREEPDSQSSAAGTAAISRVQSAESPIRRGKYSDSIWLRSAAVKSCPLLNAGWVFEFNLS